MKYLLFSGPYYYPSGGTFDFQKSFDTVTEAKEWWLKCEDPGLMWAHISYFDGEYMVTVSEYMNTSGLPKEGDEVITTTSYANRGQTIVGWIGWRNYPPKPKEGSS